MGINTEIITKKDATLHEVDILNPTISMGSKIELAADVASSLKDVIEKQELSVELRKGGEKYVLAEGWNTLGIMLGTYPKTESVGLFEGSKAKIAYKARVSIMHGEQVLSTAEAIATSNGFQRDESQIYSMAQTRAMGKAYRMAFSWIVKLAGYEPTPYEEMVIENEKQGKE